MKRFTIIVMVLMSVSALKAQHPDRNQDMEERMAELKSKKVAYFTEKLNMDSETAEKFWPIYNEYSTQRMENHKLFRDLMQKMHEGKDKGEEFSDEEYLKLADAMVSVKTSQAKIQEKYHAKFKKVLTPKQLVQYYKAEEQFGKDMLRRYRGGSEHGKGKQN